MYSTKNCIRVLLFISMFHLSLLQSWPSVSISSIPVVGAAIQKGYDASAHKWAWEVSGTALSEVAQLGVILLALPFIFEGIARLHSPLDAQKYAHVYKMAQDLAAKMNMAAPCLYDAPWLGVNAMAGMGVNGGFVAIGAVMGLPDDEMRALLAHELAHLKNKDYLPLKIFGLLFLHAMAFYGVKKYISSRDSVGSATKVDWTLLAAESATGLLLVTYLSRAREYQADATGAACLPDPSAMASLMKTFASEVPQPINPFEHSASCILRKLGGVVEWFLKITSTHPSCAERIERLNAMAIAQS